MNKSFAAFILSLLLTPAFLNAQTADMIEQLLQTKTVTCGQAALFVLQAADVPGSYDRASAEQAFRFAAEKQWLTGKAAPSKNISLKEVSLLIMQAFGIKGGPMYSIFKNPHYAYREMVYQDIIQGRTDPEMAISGDLFLYLVNRVLYNVDDAPWELPEDVKQEDVKPEKTIAAPVQEKPLEKPEEKPKVEVNNIITDRPGLTERLQWLASNAENGKAYTFEVYADESIDPQYLSYNGENISITIKGDNAERVISLKKNGYMFVVSEGVTLILDNNITIKGSNDNNYSLINVLGGSFVLNDGAKITGNNALYGGGVYIMSGAFAMNGGSVSGNAALNGGGVCVSAGTFIMKGGTISGNTARHNGGGVYVYYNGTFLKTGGTIYGHDKDESSNTVMNNYGIIPYSGSGHAVFVSNLQGRNLKLKETTAWPDVNLSLFYDNGLPIWNDGWD